MPAWDGWGKKGQYHKGRINNGAVSLRKICPDNGGIILNYVAVSSLSRASFGVQRKSAKGHIQNKIPDFSSPTGESLQSDRVRIEKATRTTPERICIEIFLLSCLYNLV